MARHSFDFIELDEAVQRIINNLDPVEESDVIKLKKARNRILARDIVSKINVPPFDRAMMDGYAVRAADLEAASEEKPVTLTVVDAIHAGSFSKKAVKAGQCAQIATGAPMPKGADAVAMIETTQSNDDGTVTIAAAVTPGLHIGPVGEDVKKGDVVLKAGSILTPAKIGAIAAIGIPEVAVYRKPVVGIMSTGNEVIKPGEKLPKGAIYDINSFTLAAIVEENGGVTKSLARTADDYDEMKKRILAAVKKCDILMLSGGTAFGEHDLTARIINDVGTTLFHGIYIKPGKPTLCGIIEDTIVLVIPGNPTSCLTNGYVLVAPALAHLCRQPFRQRIEQAELADDIVTIKKSIQFVTVRIEDGKVYSVYKSSSAITSMTYADGYIAVPRGVERVEKGSMVDVVRFL